MCSVLQAGMAQIDITPPPGTTMGAFPVSHKPMQGRVAEGVRDPLWARALALSDGTRVHVVCVADVLALQWPDVDLIRQEFSTATGMPGEALVVSATHNHNGPDCTYMFGGSPDDPYVCELRRGIVEAAVSACKAMVPAELSVAAVSPGLSFNRRSIAPNGEFRQLGQAPGTPPSGPVDPRVTVLRIAPLSGAWCGGIIHFAAHPVILTTPNRLFTAEYPGASIRHFGATDVIDAALFLQGACGDTHPHQAITNDVARVEEMGQSLADAARDAWTQVVPLREPALATERWSAELPHRYSEDHRVRVEITAWRLSDDMAVVFWQGEPFTELSLALQWRSPFARTLVVGYSLGWIGYVPTRNAYEFGGYGVSLYDNDPPEYSRTSVAPGTGECLVDRAEQLLLSLR